MTKPVELTTSDPRFDPEEPVMVNGFLFLPAERALAGSGPPPRRLVERKRVEVVEVRRRKLITRNLP